MEKQPEKNDGEEESWVTNVLGEAAYDGNENNVCKEKRREINKELMRVMRYEREKCKKKKKKE